MDHRGWKSKTIDITFAREDGEAHQRAGPQVEGASGLPFQAALQAFQFAAGVFLQHCLFALALPVLRQEIL